MLGAQSNQGRFWETRHLFNWMSTHTQKLLGIAAADQAQQQQEQQRSSKFSEVQGAPQARPVFDFDALNFATH